MRKESWEGRSRQESRQGCGLRRWKSPRRPLVGSFDLGHCRFQWSEEVGEPR